MEDGKRLLKNVLKGEGAIFTAYSDGKDIIMEAHSCEDDDNMYPDCDMCLDYTMVEDVTGWGGYEPSDGGRFSFIGNKTTAEDFANYMSDHLGVHDLEIYTCTDVCVELVSELMRSIEEHRGRLNYMSADLHSIVRRK
jgi:hypothetical protein